MNIRELAAASGVAERQIRYLIAEGFIPSPAGGRANADYGAPHVEGIRRYLRLRDLGFPPAAIKLLLAAGERAPFPVAPGVTLLVDPLLIGSGADAAPILHRLQSLLEDLLKDGEK